MVTALAAPMHHSERVAAAWQALGHVPDPEIPMLSVLDLGLVRAVEIDAHGVLQLHFSPTYCGCPATETIMRAMRQALEAAGLGPMQLSLKLSPAWTTDWITPQGRRRLAEAGIAPPGPARPFDGTAPIRLVRRPAAAPACPHCRGTDTTVLSPFGSTACKAYHRCLVCGEPFESFKPL